MNNMVSGENRNFSPENTNLYTFCILLLCQTFSVPWTEMWGDEGEEYDR